MTTLTLCTAAFCLAVGIAVVWANPHRFSNQIFSIASLAIASWLTIVYQAMKAGISAELGETGDPVPWYRANAALAAFFPGIIWLLKESILTGEGEKWRTLKRALPLVGAGLILAMLCYADTFVMGPISPGIHARGTVYVIYNSALFVIILITIAQSWFQMRRQVGIQRVEMQFLTLTFGSMSLLLGIANTVGNLLHIKALNRASVLLVFFSYALTAWAITFHRIFDARQVFLGLSQRITLPILLAFGAWGLVKWNERFPSLSVMLFLSMIVWCSTVFWLDRKSREWLRLGGEKLLSELRASVIAVARSEPTPDLLIEKFEHLLRGQTNTAFAALLSDQGKVHVSGNLILAKDRPGYAILCQTGWATPENLQRRRPTSGIDDLARFLSEHSLGLMVTVPCGSPSPSLVLALGTKTSRWPFTYPEVQLIQNLAELMDNILSHARLTSEAALKAKIEHLALMSRGLAHDLKNLITPVATFITHAEGKIETAGPEGEVHRAARRSVHLMNDYVRDALFFANRLTPNFERADLNAILETVREVTTVRAAQRGVEVRVAPGESCGLTADAVLLQRLLGNLVNNAIDASSSGSTVTLRPLAPKDGRVRLEIIDHGCGIAPENLPRIFDPYFTTKQFGDEVRGFGLGLTICDKIARLHNGSITVRSELDRGTHVTVELPSAPSAFATVLEQAQPA